MVQTTHYLLNGGITGKFDDCQHFLRKHGISANSDRDENGDIWICPCGSYHGIWGSHIFRQTYSTCSSRGHTYPLVILLALSFTMFPHLLSGKAACFERYIARLTPKIQPLGFGTVKSRSTSTLQALRIPSLAKIQAFRCGSQSSRQT